jgi:hypothetical protein
VVTQLAGQLGDAELLVVNITPSPGVTIWLADSEKPIARSACPGPREDDRGDAG